MKGNHHPWWAGHDIAAAQERNRIARWSARGKARVIHRNWGSVVVPCASMYSAILCAAEVWGCDWSGIMDAEVILYEEPELLPRDGEGETQIWKSP